MLLHVTRPGHRPERAGILILDFVGNQVFLRLQNKKWGDEIDEVLECLEDELKERAKETGAAKVGEWLQSSCSHCLQFAGPGSLVIGDNFQSSLGELYTRYIENEKPQSDIP